jgi:hypothetical protein
MRILIVSSIRCGGNSFTRWLSEELNLEYLSEPYNKKLYPTTPDIYSDNIVVKFLYPDINKIKDKNINSFVDLINSFDYAIGLIREDIRSACESVVISSIRENWIDSYYVSDGFIRSHEKRINDLMPIYRDYNNRISNLNILQVKYENIFIEKTDIIKIKNYLNIEKFNYLDILDSKYRYRKFKENNNTNII